jgi:hypothetical protein
MPDDWMLVLPGLQKLNCGHPFQGLIATFSTPSR